MQLDKKNIKQQRIESYFIDAAKELINKDGPYSVTVRKIADIAGYSYGTIYHYYKDLDDLMFNVKNNMINDIINIMDNEPNCKSDELENIKIFHRKFADYFLTNPNVYEFFYNYPIRKTGKTPMDDIRFDENRMKAYNSFVENGIIQPEDLPTVIKTIIYSMYGLLSLYFSSNGITKKQVHKDLDDLIEFILRKR